LYETLLKKRIRILNDGISFYIFFRGLLDNYAGDLGERFSFGQENL